PVVSFIKSEPKEPEQKIQSHFFPHIKYEVKEEAETMPFIPIKIKLREMDFTPKSSSHFFPHIKCEVKEEATSFILIKIEPEETAFIPKSPSHFFPHFKYEVKE